MTLTLKTAKEIVDKKGINPNTNSMGLQDACDLCGAQGYLQGHAVAAKKAEKIIECAKKVIKIFPDEDVGDVPGEIVDLDMALETYQKELEE